MLALAVVEGIEPAGVEAAVWVPALEAAPDAVAGVSGEEQPNTRMVNANNKRRIT